MLAAVDLDHEALLETDEIKNVVPERNLSPKFEMGEPPMTQQRHIAASASVGARRMRFAKLRIGFVIGR